MAKRETKKDKAERLALEHARLHALVWPSYPKPVPLSHDAIMKLCGDSCRYVEAWFMNEHTLSVTRGWTHTTLHCREWKGPLPKTWQDTRDRGSVSRDSGECYRTRLEAWQAMRWEVTEKCAAMLHRADLVRERDAD